MRSPSMQPAPKIGPDPERQFICNECGKTYKFAANLERVSNIYHECDDLIVTNALPLMQHWTISNRCKTKNRATGTTENRDEDILRKRKVKERERLATELLEIQ